MDKVTKQCPQTTTFRRERRAEAVSNRGPSPYQPYALPLGHSRLVETLDKCLYTKKKKKKKKYPKQEWLLAF